MALGWTISNLVIVTRFFLVDFAKKVFLTYVVDLSASVKLFKHLVFQKVTVNACGSKEIICWKVYVKTFIIYLIGPKLWTPKNDLVPIFHWKVLRFWKLKSQKMASLEKVALLLRTPLKIALCQIHLRKSKFLLKRPGACSFWKAVLLKKNTFKIRIF